MPGDHSFGRAVIDEGSAAGRLEAQLHLLAGVDEGQRAAAQRAGGGVEVDVVRVGVSREVGQRDLDHVTDTTAQHGTGRAAHHLGVSCDAESPDLGGHLVGRIDRAHSLDYLERHFPATLVGAGDRRRSLRGVGGVHLIIRGSGELGGGHQRGANAAVGGPGPFAATARTLGGDDLAHVGGGQISLLYDDCCAEHHDHCK